MVKSLEAITKSFHHHQALILMSKETSVSTHHFSESQHGWVGRASAALALPSMGGTSRDGHHSSGQQCQGCTILRVQDFLLHTEPPLHTSKSNRNFFQLKQAFWAQAAAPYHPQHSSIAPTPGLRHFLLLGSLCIWVFEFWCRVRWDTETSIKCLIPSAIHN